LAPDDYGDLAIRRIALSRSLKVSRYGAEDYCGIESQRGVGKTTTCFNLTCAFAEQGFRILAVDLDP
jgi:putative protein kinase ArgK-like GTPase of G3E family